MLWFLSKENILRNLCDIDIRKKSIKEKRRKRKSYSYITPKNLEHKRASIYYCYYLYVGQDRYLMKYKSIACVCVYIHYNIRYILGLEFHI